MDCAGRDAMYVDLLPSIVMTFDETVLWTGNITIAPTFQNSMSWGHYYGGV